MNQNFSDVCHILVFSYCELIYRFISFLIVPNKIFKMNHMRCSITFFSSPQSFSAFVASKRDGSQEEGSTSWCCCGQTFKEHSAIHRHVARTHDAEIQQLTQAAYECLLSQLEEEPETQKKNEHEAETVDISTWIPEINHISEEQLQKYWSNVYSPV